jgi:hypothetical protein
MDETDTGQATEPITGHEAMSAEAARQWAEQRRAAARAEFQTPVWLGPARADQPQIPAQVEPEHDELDEIEIPARAAQHHIPDIAHWAETAKPRLVAGVVLFAALTGVIVFLVLTITTQSVNAIAGLVGSAFVAVIFRGALMGSALTTVDLKGPILRIRSGGVLDVVNLADPVHIVELIGTPDQPTWRLRLEAVDGRTVELGPKQVDPSEMHRIVEYYRAVAERDKRDKERRFNR